MLCETAWNSVREDPQVMAEITRARTLTPMSLSSIDFMREYAWAAFNSGMKMEVIRRIWPDLEQAFRHWDYKAIIQDASSVRNEAIAVFRNQRKVSAVIHTAGLIEARGWDTVEAEIKSAVIAGKNNNLYPSGKFYLFVQQLPWIGPTNSRYLAKNLGFDLAKDDRHLKRLAQQYGYTPNSNGVQRLVEDVSMRAKERISVMETVLWNACEKGAI
jgi:hypothetical protein